MLLGQKLTALIPVRGGSKGIPGKNLRKIGKYTLLERAIKLARAEPRIDQILVSTDDAQMYEIAKEYGVATPNKRPAHLATDEARTIDVVEDLVKAKTLESGVLLLLQATSPLRSQSDLSELLDLYEKGGATAFVSLCETRGEPPEKLQTVKGDEVVSLLGVEQGRPRQTMTQTYEVNGAFYLIDLARLIAEKTFIPAGTRPFIMPLDRSANLDTQQDWDMLQAMLETGRWTFEDYD